MKSKSLAPTFYFGILISSIGSGAFSIALFAFLLMNQFSLSQAAMLLGLQRLVPTMVVALTGQWTDRWAPRPTIFVAEVIAAMLSLALLLIWRGAETNLMMLTVLSVGRAVIVSFQQGSRAKISKILSGDTFAGNSRHAMWLNKVTQGASLFSGALAWLFVKYGSLEAAILFDFGTFALNGLIVLLLPKFIESTVSRRERWQEKFQALITLHPKEVLFDLALFLSTGGLVVYSARIAKDEPGWSGLFLAAYGLAVWAAGFAERSFTRKFSTVPFWIGIAVAYLTLGQFNKASVSALAVSFAKDFCFWVIFHRVSAQLQMRTPSEKMGSITSARSVVIVIVSAGVEVLVGAWSSFVTLPLESAIRAAIAVGAGAYVYATSKRSYSQLGRQEINDVTHR